MTRDELKKEVNEFIDSNFADDADIDPSDAGSQIDDHLTQLAEEIEDDEEDVDDEE